MIEQRYSLSIRTLRGNLRNQEQWLAQLHTQAADLERGGRPPTQHLHDSIERAGRAINEQRGSIATAQTNKEKVRHAFDLMIEHYQRLTDPLGAAPPAAAPP